MDEPLNYIPESPDPIPPRVSDSVAPAMPAEAERHLELPAPKWWHRLPSSLSPRRVIVAGLALFALALASFGFAASAPGGFPVGEVFVVEKGETLSGAARGLDAQEIIRSPFLFKAFLTFFAGSKGLAAGDYYLPEKQGVIGIAWRLSRGQYGLENVRVTIPEGLNVEEIAVRLGETFNTFDADEFLRIASPYEGYLFPDTYLFLPNVAPEQVLKAMTDNYQRRIVALESEIKAFGKPIKDVITMASIIEDEARTEESRRMIAGILWKRLSIDMPLQVDAAFAKVNGKSASSDLTLDDLKIENPYNTYVNRGLPPGPISNPGLDSIRATVTPVASQYFYYLTDNDGVMRYAATHDGHVANKERYLR